MKDYLDLIERTLSDSIPDERPAVLSEAMRYAVGTGGKRIRPVFVFLPVGQPIAVGVSPRAIIAASRKRMTGICPA